MWRRRTRKQRQMMGLVLVATLVFIVVIRGTQPMIDPTAYTPLLNTIAKGESNGNYNAYFGSAGNEAINFTSMTVGEVMDWQQKYVEAGHASNAVGRYQFMGTTLRRLVGQMHINTQTRFDEKLQDHLAIKLIEQRGAFSYVQEKLTPEQFASNLSQEWAALPRAIGPNATQSYYAGDGLNASRVSVGEVLAALQHLKQKNK